MLTRNREITQSNLRRRLDELRSDYRTALGDIEQLPKEYQLVSPAEFKVDSVDDMLGVNSQLGRLATVSTVGAAARYIRQTTHAPLKVVDDAA